REEIQAPELCRQRGEVLVGLLFGEHFVRLLHPRDGLVQASRLPLDFAEARGDPSGRVGLPGSFEKSERTLQVSLRLGTCPRGPGRRASPLEERGLDNRLVGELGRALEIVLRLLTRR